MRITVNDQGHDLPDGATVRDLVTQMGLENKPCAVEVNRSVVRKGDHVGHVLREGDTVELVTLVGGG